MEPPDTGDPPPDPPSIIDLSKSLLSPSSAPSSRFFSTPLLISNSTFLLFSSLAPSSMSALSISTPLLPLPPSISSSPTIQTTISPTPIAIPNSEPLPSLNVPLPDSNHRSSDAIIPTSIDPILPSKVFSSPHDVIGCDLNRQPMKAGSMLGLPKQSNEVLTSETQSRSKSFLPQIQKSKPPLNWSGIFSSKDMSSSSLLAIPQPRRDLVIILPAGCFGASIVSPSLDKVRHTVVIFLVQFTQEVFGSVWSRVMIVVLSCYVLPTVVDFSSVSFVSLHDDNDDDDEYSKMSIQGKKLLIISEGDEECRWKKENSNKVEEEKEDDYPLFEKNTMTNLRRGRTLWSWIKLRSLISSLVSRSLIFIITISIKSHSYQVVAMSLVCSIVLKTFLIVGLRVGNALCIYPLFEKKFPGDFSYSECHNEEMFYVFAPRSTKICPAISSEAPYL